jgi:hypothetical protein
MKIIIMDLDFLNKSWIEIIMTPSSKTPLVELKINSLEDADKTAEEIRKLNVYFDNLGINFYELDLLPLEKAIFDSNTKLVKDLKNEIKSKLLKVISEQKMEELVSKYEKLLSDLEIYVMSDLYKIKDEIEKMDDENFDAVFNKKDIIEGLKNMIEDMADKNMKHIEIKNKVNETSIFKQIYEAYFFEITKAKNIFYFLHLVLD